MAESHRRYVPREAIESSFETSYDELLAQIEEMVNENCGEEAVGCFRSALPGGMSS